MTNLIQKILAHPYAIWGMMLISFAESSVFPLPPDFILIGLMLQYPTRIWWLSFLCTISSVFGGILGYILGRYFLYYIAAPIIQWYHWEGYISYLELQFQQWGFWFIVLKGFTPIPFKLVTISAGMFNFPIISFLFASFLSRSIRFFILGGIVYLWGDKVKEILISYQTIIIRIFVLVSVIIMLYIFYIL